MISMETKNSDRKYLGDGRMKQHIHLDLENITAREMAEIIFRVRNLEKIPKEKMTEILLAYICDKDGPANDVVNLIERAGYYNQDERKKILMRGYEHNLEGKSFRALEDAGEFAEQAKELEMALDCYKQGKFYRHASYVAEKLGNTKEAIEFARKIEWGCDASD